MLFIWNLIAGTEVQHTMSVYCLSNMSQDMEMNEKIFKTYLEILIEKIDGCGM